MPELTWSPLLPEHIPAWHCLLEAIVEADGGVEHLSQDDLADELSPSWRDPERDGWFVIDGDGAAVAFGTHDVRPGDRSLLRARCWGGVHPAHRGQGIGRELLGRQVRRARERVAQRREELAGPEVPGAVMVEIPEGARTASALLAHAGLRQARLSRVMRRDLADPVPDPPVPAGLSIRAYQPEWSDAVRLAHNVAFAQSWGIQPWSAETWLRWETGHRDFRPEWSFVAFDRLGVAGYVMSGGYETDWAADGFTQGWTNKLGVRPDRRKQGLAAALLARAMRAYRESGMQYAGLDVDAENASNAVALYTNLGYEVRHTSVTWTLDV